VAEIAYAIRGEALDDGAAGQIKAAAAARRRRVVDRDAPGGPSACRRHGTPWSAMSDGK